MDVIMCGILASVYCYIQMIFYFWRPPSVSSSLQLHDVWLDMSINVEKSSCMRIGPRFNAHCIVASLLAMVEKYYGVGRYVSVLRGAYFCWA